MEAHLEMFMITCRLDICMVCKLNEDGDEGKKPMLRPIRYGSSVH